MITYKIISEINNNEIGTFSFIDDDKPQISSIIVMNQRFWTVQEIDDYELIILVKLSLFNEIFGSTGSFYGI